MVRVKRRYIAFNLRHQLQQNLHQSQQQSLSQDALIRELRDKIGQVYGDFGLSCLNRGFSIKKFDPKEGNVIIVVRKGVHDMLMSVFPLITSIDRTPCSLNLVHLSGTIRGCLKNMKTLGLMNLRASIAESKAKSISRVQQDQ